MKSFDDVLYLNVCLASARTKRSSYKAGMLFFYSMSIFADVAMAVLIFKFGGRNDWMWVVLI